MPRGIPPLLGRRLVLSGSVAASTLPLSMKGVAQTAQLPPTPRQTTGPFYPVDWSGDVNADLVRSAGEAARAQGVVTLLRGVVFDARGSPCLAWRWRSGSVMLLAATAIRATAREDTIRASRVVGVW